MLGRTAVLTCSLASAPLLLGRVSAQDDSADSKPITIKAAELPLYGEPEPAQYEFVPEEVGGFRKAVSSMRQGVWGFMDSIKDTTDKAKEKYEIGKAHSADLLHRIQEDTGAMGRTAIIVVAGLGGTVLGYRGGYGRKAFYASAGMVSATALCYPKEAMDIANTGWAYVKDTANQSGLISKSEDKSSAAKSTKPAVNETPQQEDHGMSKAEDQDMYTTRKS